MGRAKELQARPEARPELRPMISLAMMVKNEEEMLPACLESAAPWVDEIVVVDTGSTDRTVEIAASFGARVFHHPWQQNFSLHRNQSIGYCRGEWILILDADEELEPGSGEVLRRAANEARSEVVTAVVRSIFDSGRGEGAHVSNRMFRNNGRILYEGRVHNLLVGHRSVESWPIRIYHKGYNVAEATEAKKFERTVSLLKLDIAEDPTRPRPHHYLATSYLTARKLEESLFEAKEAIRLAEAQGNDDDQYIWSHYLAASASMDLGMDEESEHWCRAALRKRPHHFDSHFLLARLAIKRNDWAAILAESEIYLEQVARFHEDPGAFGSIVFNTARYEWWAWHYRALALAETGQPQTAEAAFERAEEYALDRPYCIRLRGRYYGYAKRWEEARRHLARSLDLKPGDAEALMDIAAAWAGEGRPEEERLALERVLAAEFLPKAAARLAQLDLVAGELARAREHLERSLAAEPDNASALVNLGLCLRLAGDNEAATLPLERACRLDPELAPAQANLAHALAALGDPRARSALERAAEMTPGTEGADTRLKLCRLALEEGDVDGLLGYCDGLLRCLQLRFESRLESMTDLGELFLQVGERLLDMGQRGTEDAFGLACLVAPALRTKGADIYRGRGLWREALGQLESQLLARPGAETLTEMGEVYTQLGLTEAASLCHAEAAALAPGEGGGPLS
jgi:glycosyltransferase involved in cell wall biosynthesis